MMKSVAALLALAVTGADAFAPAAPAATARTALDSDAVADDAAPAAPAGTVWDNYVGGEDFRGGKFEFDPLRLSETYSPLVPFFREAELRHGRTAMLAVVGFITTDFVRIPGAANSFEAIPKTVDAHNALLDGPMQQLLLWIGLFDLVLTVPAIQATMNGEREAGDFGFVVPGGARANTKENMDKKRVSELLNGRLAMCAIGGIATQTVLTGHGFPYL